MTRIALIHALAHSVAPVNQAFEQLWPQAQRMNLLDDSLSADLARSGAGLDAVMNARFAALADYAVGTGAQGILFTCSAFVPCIEAVARRHPQLPVLKPNEAMIEEALAHVRHDSRIGLVASFGPTLASMPAEFPRGTPLETALAEGALEALDRGDLERHDQLVAGAATTLAARGCDVIALAQFSLARAQARVVQRTGLPVLTTVETAVRKLRGLLA